MTRRPPSQLPRHLLERPPILRFPAPLDPPFEGADLELARLDEFVDIEGAVLKGSGGGLGGEGAGVALAGAMGGLGTFVRVGVGGGLVRGACWGIFALFGGLGRLARRPRGVGGGHWVVASWM